MSEFKEFQGKNLDEAINNACDHFNLNRDKLEIEILSGGSTGVFGLVGKKNAKVKARPRGGESRSLLNSGRPERSERPTERPIEKPVERQVEKPVERKVEAAPERVSNESPAVKEETAVAPRPVVETPAVKEEYEVAVRPEAKSPAVNAPSADRDSDTLETDSEDTEGFRERRSIMEADPKDIEAAVREALEKMIEPIVQQAPNLKIEVGEDRVNVLVDDEENSGLIIGREGQTLSSLQYLCNRMVSKKLQTSVRVQIDTGDYRERQDEKLRQLAWHLADKAMHTGRVQSTKPLSSYHRRVVHMALQEDKHVNTRSKGDGPMKRVLILPRRSRNAGGRGPERTERTERPERTERTEGYKPQSSARYDSRSSERGAPRGPERGAAPRPERGAPRSPAGAPRGRNENYGNRPRTEGYVPRGRNENSAPPRGRDENFGNRAPSENAGNRAPRDENFGNRAPRDENFGNRAPRYNDTRSNDSAKNGNTGNVGNYGDDRYNRY